MNKDTILECMYKVIKDSLEWGVESRNGSYGYFVDGVVAVAEALLEKVDSSVLIVEAIDDIKSVQNILYAAEKPSQKFHDNLAKNFSKDAKA